MDINKIIENSRFSSQFSQNQIHTSYYTYYLEKTFTFGRKERNLSQISPQEIKRNKYEFKNE